MYLNSQKEGYMKIIYLLLGVAFVSIILLTRMFPTPTPEERQQQRLANVSKPPHIDNNHGVVYIVKKVFDDFPHSALVRVVLVPVGEGAILVAQHPRCEPLVIGQKVGLVFADYMNSEYNNDPMFYIKVD